MSTRFYPYQTDFITQLNLMDDSIGGGGGGGSAITVSNEGSSLTTALTSLNFVGNLVNATNSGGAVTVTIAGTTTEITEGSNLYYTDARVRAAVLTGLSTVSTSTITAASTVLGALGQLQGQVTANLGTYSAHAGAGAAAHAAVTTSVNGFMIASDKVKLDAITGTNTGDSPLIVKDEGTNKTTATTSIDFVGAGVTVTNTGQAATVTISGSGGSALEIKDEGTSKTTAATYLNFIGSGVNVTNTGGNVDVTISGSGLADTDSLTEGSSNLYFTAQRVRDALLTALSTASAATITATDSVLSAFGKLQKQITDNLASFTSHAGSGATAHAAVTTSVNGFMIASDKTKLDAITGTNTGDETTATIKSKLSISTLSGSNTGDSPLEIRDEGTSKTPAATMLDFVGAGVTVTNTGGAATITIPSSSGITALTSDVTASGTGSVAATIAAGAVTLAKMANMATASFIGRNTAATGVPEILSASTAASIIGPSMTSLGTVTSGTWSATTIAANKGGTGVSNAGTITAPNNVNFANSFSTSGAFAMTLTATASTNVTLPTTGTLASLAGTETLTNKTLTTPTINGFVEGRASASGTSFSPDITSATDFEYTTTGNATLNLPTPVAGKSYTVTIIYGGTHTLTISGGGTIKHAGGSPPTVTGVSGKEDMYVMKCNHAGTTTKVSDGGRNY